MAVLSDGSITRAVRSHVLRIKPFHRDALQPASYDMRLHWKLLISPTRHENGRVVDLRRESGRKCAVEPGRFIGTLTEERLDMPLTMTGRFGLRSEFTRRGLIAFGGIQIDPGFKGRLAISLFNAGPEPVEMEQGRRMFTVEFHTLDIPAKAAYSGDYQDQTDFPEDQQEFILKARTVSLAEIAALPEEIADVRRDLALHERLLHATAGVPTLQELAAAQGVEPVSGPEEFVGGWPDDQDFETFLNTLRSLRETRR